MEINSRIKSLRALMHEKNIDVYIIPSSDSHQSEYTQEHFKSRQWISGFTGSAGTVVITKEKAILWTDGRYFIQAEKELEGSEVELFKMGEKDVPTINKYLRENLKEGQTLGFDGKLFSYKEAEKMKQELSKKGININVDYDLVDNIWTDRPELPKGKVFIHDIQYSGLGVDKKLKCIRDIMSEKNADYYLVSSLDDIAWMFNIRGFDILYNPVVISYALIGLKEATIFIENEKLDVELSKYLEENNIDIKGYFDIKEELGLLPVEENIYLDQSKTSVWAYENIPSDMKKLDGNDIVEGLKSIKNEIEVKNFKRAQVRDGVAMVKFLHWLESNIKDNNITELSASKKLEEFRAEGENYISLSFDTIAGYKDHGAIVHYSADKESEYKLKAEGMLLLDSGAQYLDGTTDITRTIVLGEISDEEKRDFTLVLKGHIALSRAKFLYGTTGTQLDILARTPLWEEGKDYKHGTGHGVGYLLGVHEGPQRISSVNSEIKLESGMFVTNEPGFYKRDEYGIRTENILLVREERQTEYGKFMKFETTTLCPIDLKGIDKTLLDESEKRWLNEYHKNVYEKLVPHLNKQINEWLKVQTKQI